MLYWVLYCVVELVTLLKGDDGKDGADGDDGVNGKFSAKR